MLWLFVHRICPNLIEFVSLEAIRSESPTEATTCIESYSIRSHAESLSRPVSIYHEFFSCIVLVPGFSFVFTYCSSIFYGSMESVLRMESSMHDDEFFFFYHNRESLDPVEVSIFFQYYFKWFWFFSLRMDPFFSSFTEYYSSIIYVSEHLFIREAKIFMIPYHWESIRTMADVFHDFEWLRSLVDEISDEVYSIIISDASMSDECHEFIIASMYISDEECSLLHKAIIEASLENAKFTFLQTTVQIHSFSFYTLPNLLVTRI